MKTLKDILYLASDVLGALSILLIVWFMLFVVMAAF